MGNGIPELTAVWLQTLFETIGCLFAATSLIHWFQLESYQFPGYFRTLKRQSIRGWTSGILMTAFVWLASFLVRSLISEQLNWLRVVLICLCPIAAGVLLWRWSRKQKAKKKLVYTSRVKRLYAVCFIVWWVILIMIESRTGNVLFADTFPGLFIICAFPLLLPLWVALGGLLAWPIEKGISELYFRDAQRILMERKDLIRIGITGSWGKTSVKFILGSLLSEKYPTLVTPASFNTPMGVTKVIRTQLEPGHRIFIAEMGARHVGDIREMCRLVHPSIGILTSVGPQHLDTFHTLQRVIRTKYELIEAIPDEGSCFFADDDGIVKDLCDKTSKEKYLTGLNSVQDDFWVENIQVSPSGSSFILCTSKEKIPCETELIGELNIRNIVLCAAVCYKMGLTGKEIARGIRKLKPVEHRLELRHNPGGINVLDDAFNSNIKGAEQAFQVLKKFPKNRIIVTPGMVELGDQENEMNRRFGQLMASCCDEVILVGHKRSEAILNGLRDEHFDETHIQVVSSLNDAAVLLKTKASPGDTILFENDLPDNYSEE